MPLPRMRRLPRRRRGSRPPTAGTTTAAATAVRRALRCRTLARQPTLLHPLPVLALLVSTLSGFISHTADEHPRDVPLRQHCTDEALGVVPATSSNTVIPVVLII
jgi:hypothetical protein